MIRSICLPAFLTLAVSSVGALEIERHMSVSASGASRQGEVVKGEVLARFAPSVSSGAVRSAARARGGDDGGALAIAGWRLLKLPPGMRVAEGLGHFKNIPGLEVIQPNHAYRPSRVPNDPFINSQYALSRMSAYAGWEYEVGESSRVTIAVIDTGMDATHPELQNKSGDTVSQYCNPGLSKLTHTDNSACVTETETPACNHGTRVAGLAAAETGNTIGIAGVSWGAQIVSLRVFRKGDCPADCSALSCATDDKAIADALSFLTLKQNSTDYGKIVANISLGSEDTPCSDSSNDFTRAAVAAASDAGILILSAAGNDSSSVNSPANCAGVVPVGATDSDDKLAYFSSRGPEMALRGLSAPGVGIYTTDMGGGYASANGTSFSTPLTAGAAALVWAAKPVYTSTDVANVLRNTADDLGVSGPDNNFGYGRVNIHRALRYAVEGTLAGFKGETKAIAFPNPFRPVSDRILSFSFPADTAGSDLKIEIYTMEGELVKKLDGLTWDGLNAAGNPAATGVYLFLVKSDSGKARGKFAIIR